MTGRPRLYAGLELLDRQLRDRDGRLCGNVDDLEIERSPDTGELYVTAFVAGPGALLQRTGPAPPRGLDRTCRTDSVNDPGTLTEPSSRSRSPRASAPTSTWPSTPTTWPPPTRSVGSATTSSATFPGIGTVRLSELLDRERGGRGRRGRSGKVRDVRLVQDGPILAGGTQAVAPRRRRDRQPGVAGRPPRLPAR